MMTYDKYKDSSVEWIGIVPEHWDTLRLRFVCELRNGYTPSKANPDFWTEGTIPWYRMEDIRESGRRLKEAKQYITVSAIKGGGLFEAGSYIMATTATIGEHAVLIVDSLANQRFTNLKIRKSLSHSDFKEFFFQYLFVVNDYCKTTTKTATFPAVNMEDLKNFIICIPPKNEQKQILAYLDKKCADIDKVIATQQCRIELLQELKQSTITHAVTHGLDSNVKMKDSGVEWIGMVPEHWEVMKSSLMSSSIGSGTTPNTNNKDYYCENEEGYNWLQTGDLNNGLIISTQKKVSKKAIKECNLKFYPKDSIVIAMYGATIGKVGILGFDTAVNQACCVLSKTNKIVSKYVFYLFLSAKESLLISAIGGGQPNINQEVIKKLKVTVPPLSEQQAIATNLDKKCADIDNSISKAQREIDLLQEYKQSLITEVVTGKRKVC